MVHLALEAAVSGHFVIGGLTAHTATEAVNHLIEAFPSQHRRQARVRLAETLRGVVAQVLVRKSSGGRIAVREVLLNTPDVANLIAEDKTAQLPRAIEAGKSVGMMPLNDALVDLVQSGALDADEAYRRAADRPGLTALLKRQGIGSPFLEHLA
jgi:twitching motility protein PilT